MPLNPNAPGYTGTSGAQLQQDATNQQQGANSSWQQGQGARGSQQDALGLMRNAALGNAPSVAAQQQQQGLDAAIKSQQAMAASARGPGGLASAQYNAASNTGALQQGAVGQAAQLRAGEMAQARGAYGDAANGMRGQDIQSAMGQGQQALGYQGMEQNVGMANLQAQGQQNQLDEQHWAKQADLDAASQAAMMSNITGAIGAGAGAASMFSDEDIKTNKMPLQSPTHGFAEAAIPEEKIHPSLGNAFMMSTAAPKGLNPDGPQGPTGKPASELTAATAAGMKPEVKGETPAVSKWQNALGALSHGMLQMSANQNPRGSRMPDFQAPPMPMNKPQMAVPPVNAQPAAMVPPQLAMHGPVATQGPSQLVDMSGRGEPVGMHSQFADNMPGPGMMSDERVKMGLDPRHAEPAAMMDHLEPYSYDYKPGLGLPEGRKYGIMAQDLERTPMGASVVHETPRGKAIDAAQATGLHFAAEANLHQRLRALEAKRGR